MNPMKALVLILLALSAVTAGAQNRNGVYYVGVRAAGGEPVLDSSGKPVVVSYVGDARIDPATLRATDPVTRASLGLSPTSTIPVAER
jgi:hypothetical protein